MKNTTVFEEKLSTKTSEPTYSADMPKSPCKCQPNFEYEYYRQIEIIKKLKSENTELKKTILNMCKWLFVDRESGWAE